MEMDFGSSVVDAGVASVADEAQMRSAVDGLDDMEAMLREDRDDDPVVVRPRTFYRRWREFSCFDQGDRLVMPPDFVSVIGALLPIALCGRSSL